MEARRHVVGFQSPRQGRIHDLLQRLISHGAADFFADACELLQQRPALRTATHIVGHLTREVEGAVLTVLITLPGAVQWLKANPVVTGDRQTHARKVKAILSALSLDSHHAASTWTSFTGPDGWSRDAHRDDLQFPRRIDNDFSSRFEAFCNILAVVLDAAEADYATVIRALDGVLLRAIPSNEDVKLLSAYLAPGVTALAYIFAKLPSAWLVPLREQRVFTEPPELVTNVDGSIGFPAWPQGGYLERVAAEEPAEVATTIESIPSVDNENVHWCLIRAALKMPPGEAARVARHELTWLGSRRSLGNALPHVVRDLAKHLALGKEFHTTVALLRMALEFHPRTNDDTQHWSETRLPSWDHNETVAECFPILVEGAPDDGKSLLFELLDSCLENSQHAWRQTIRDSRQGYPPSPFDSLVVALRTIYEGQVRNDAGALREAIAELELRPDPLYSRLALHLLGKHGAEAEDLVLGRATDQARLDSSELSVELGAMIRERFATLSPGGQQQLIDALRQNSSPEHIAQLVAYPADHELVARHALSTRRKLFALLGNASPANVRAEYEALRTAEGATSTHSHGLRIGPNSPRSAVELSALTDADLLRYLEEWVPVANDPFEPSRNGLGLELKTCAKADPQRFSRLARSFRDLSPEYAATLFWGLHEAIAVGIATVENFLTLVDWDSALDLAEHITDQRLPLVEGADSSSWTWARGMAIDFVEDAALVAIDREAALTGRTCEILMALLDDADPSVARAATTGSDLVTFAANTVRGSALQSVLTVGAALAGSPSEANRSLVKLLVREIVRRADAETEPSHAIRSVIARNYNALFLIDRAPAESVGQLLFPTNSNSSEERIALWQTFLAWNPPSQSTLAVLLESYSRGVDVVSETDQRTANNLGEHLVLLAGAGVIGHESSDRLLSRFVEKAPAIVRRHALNHLGRALHNNPAPLGEDSVDRLIELWDWWEQVALRHDDATDLAAFGWWFTSSDFESSWSLAKLTRLLNVTRGVLDWDHEVADKLASLAESMPNEVVECLAKFVETSPDHRVYYCMASIQSALRTLASGPGAASVRSISSRLVARGWPEFQTTAQSEIP